MENNTVSGLINNLKKSLLGDQQIVIDESQKNKIDALKLAYILAAHGKNIKVEVTQEEHDILEAVVTNEMIIAENEFKIVPDQDIKTMLKQFNVVWDSLFEVVDEDAIKNKSKHAFFNGLAVGMNHMQDHDAIEAAQEALIVLGNEVGEFVLYMVERPENQPVIDWLIAKGLIVKNGCVHEIHVTEGVSNANPEG